MCKIHILQILKNRALQKNNYNDTNTHLKKPFGYVKIMKQNAQTRRAEMLRRNTIAEIIEGMRAAQRRNRVCVHNVKIQRRPPQIGVYRGGC